MRITLNRDSVCAGDDMEVHKTSIDLEASATLDTLIEKLQGVAYLANVSGGEATWIICASGKPIGVAAQQWSHAKLTVPGDSTVGQVLAGDEPELSFRYWCQQNPDLVFEHIKQGKALPSRFS